MAKIGKVITRLREQKGWTQGQLALHSGLASSHISRIERGERENPSIETVAAIALALGASIDSLCIEAGLFPQPEGNKPWTPALLVMQRALNLYPPGSEERDHIERIIIAQAEAYLQFKQGREEEPDEKV